MFMEETFRWYGPSDPVSLKAIKQCGCEGVITSLHHIPYGQPWPLADIRQRLAELAEFDLRWAAVESVPVSEDIKTRTGDYLQHIENYKETIKNLGTEGVDVVIYNFMPVLDWVRTDLKHRLPDGTTCLYFDPVHFAAFEIYLLKRPGAESDYTQDQLAQAKVFFDSMTPDQAKKFERALIDVFPGCKLGLEIQDVRDMLAKYDNIDRAKLQEHLRLFLEEVIPVCQQYNVKMAIHPDDPPYQILGLPRIVCNEQDVKELLTMVDKRENGLCFCTGSYSANLDNDLPGMADRYGDRIHVAHLRSTQKNADGSFFEANHLEGSVDMYNVVKALLNEQKRRKDAGLADYRMFFRPDHGHDMLDDQQKPDAPNPGYTCIGRMRGLAEIRGLELGIARSIWGPQSKQTLLR